VLIWDDALSAVIKSDFGLLRPRSDDLAVAIQPDIAHSVADSKLKLD
jgi:hypothetical protein